MLFFIDVIEISQRLFDLSNGNGVFKLIIEDAIDLCGGECTCAKFPYPIS